MPKDPRKTWERFARAAMQEQDPEKLPRLIQQLYHAQDEDEKQGQVVAQKPRAA